MYNHEDLHWQYQYAGVSLVNLRILVCDSCYDTPQDQLRTVILPPDPVPINFPLPEVYTATDNPLSPVGLSPIGMTNGANIGNMINRGGLDAAFDGFVNKFAEKSATIAISNSSYQNFIGKNWNYAATGHGIPSNLLTSISYTVSSFTVYGPFNAPVVYSPPSITTGAGVFDAAVFDNLVFDGGVATVAASTLPTGGLQLQGSNDGTTWTVLYSTTFSGTNGEVLTSNSSLLIGGNYQYHRIAIQGDGAATIAVAQVQFNVTNTGQNEQ